MTPASFGAALAAAAVTIAVFYGVRALSDGAARGHPLANPVLWSAVVVLALLRVGDIGVGAYRDAARPLLFLLDLSVVALAMPLVASVRGAGRRIGHVLVALVGGGVTAMVSAVGLARLFGLSAPLVQALSVKSISSGFAIALMDRFGGPAPLAAGLVVTTGMIGALTLPPILKRLGYRDEEMGLATGQAAHIVGTDALLRRSRTAGAHAALAMALSGLIGAALLPLIWPLIS